MYLFSDRATFQTCAKKSRHNPILFVKEPSHLTEWKLVPVDPNFRMEMEGMPAPVSTHVLVLHLSLRIETNYVWWKATI